MAQAVGHRAHQHAQHRIIERRQLVVHPQSFLPRLHQAFFSQVGKMARRRRLRNAEALVDIADANLAVGEQAKNSEPGRIRERLERFFEGDEPGISCRHMPLDNIRQREYCPYSIFV